MKCPKCEGGAISSGQDSSHFYWRCTECEKTWKTSYSMFIPRGYTEQQVISDINHVINALSKYFKFGYHEIEDMKQEGFAFALKSLPYYNSKYKTSLRTFLYVQIKNQFINMKRDQYFNKVEPCEICIFYNNKKNMCIKFDDKKTCERYINWIKYNDSKRILIQPSKYESSYCQDKFFDIFNYIYVKEIFQIINDNLPICFRHDYCRFLHGARLSECRKDVVIQMIKKILIKKGVLEDE